MTLPYSFQIKGARKIHQLGGRALLADSMGLGKSYQALMYHVRHESITSPMIVVCPASLKFNWELECRKHYNLSADVLSSMSAYNHFQDRGLTQAPRITVINYDILEPWLGYLLSLRAKYLVIDEAHLLGNRSIKRSKLVRALSMSIPHIVALTGTPLTNRPVELWTTLNVLRPDLFPSFYSFANRYAKRQRKPWGITYSGAAHMRELHEILTREVMIRRRKEDVLTELPPKTRSILPIDIEDRKQYEEAGKDFLTWLRKNYLGRAGRAERAAGLVKVGYLRRLTARLKMKAALEWVKNFLEGSEEKLILFGVHRDILEEVRRTFKKCSVLVNGEVSLGERKKRVEIFQSDPLCRLFVGNIRAAGVGINLTAASSVAFLELGWTPSEMIQAEDRAWGRLSDIHGCNVYYLIGRGTIEEKVLRILQEKQGMSDGILDGRSDVSLDVYDQLCQELLREK